MRSYIILIAIFGVKKVRLPLCQGWITYATRSAFSLVSGFRRDTWEPCQTAANII